MIDIACTTTRIHGGAGATYLVSIQFPPSFPGRPPLVRFQSPIQHVNINAHGRVCHAIIGRDWTSSTTARQVLDCVYGLLLCVMRC